MKKVAFVLVLGSYLSVAGAVGFPVQVVSPTTTSVNGSAEDMGCTSPLTVTSGVTICGSPGNGAMSYLVDGVSPDIDTSTSDWASQLVTVRRSEGTANVTFPHVLLTFGFDTAVSLTGIEIDLFNCSDWNIGGSRISVYPNPEYDLFFNSSDPVDSKEGSTSSCDSLSTVTMTGDHLQPEMYYQTVHVLVTFTDHPFIEWVYVGEVRFLNSSGHPIVFSVPSSTTTPHQTETAAISTVGEVANSHESKLASTVLVRLQPTSVPGDRENDCTCSEESSSTAVIAVSAVSLLLIVILTTVILTQCLLIIRMRRSRNKTETYAEATSPITNTTHVPVSPNEAYALTKIASPREEVTYELVK